MKNTLLYEAHQVKDWLKDYTVQANRKSLVVGVSGGVDSALVSTLCAMTGLPTLTLVLPCHSRSDGLKNARMHIDWLKSRFKNVVSDTIDLTETYNMFKKTLAGNYVSPLAHANTKSRLRMIALYQAATSVDGLVVGTGNKVEDFGVGFFTKYGDGGVDISPIAEFMKSEVRQMCRELGVLPELCEAVPTDGLWSDTRTDETQLGATYDELEWAMAFREDFPDGKADGRNGEVLAVYDKWHKAGAHKLLPIPTYRRS